MKITVKMETEKPLRVRTTNEFQHTLHICLINI